MHLLLAIKKKINWRCLEGRPRLANWEHWEIPRCARVFGPTGSEFRHAPGLKYDIPNPVGFDHDDHRTVEVVSQNRT